MTDHHDKVIWQKSTRSMSGDNNCVEIAFLPDEVLMRDSTNPHGSILRFSHQSWTTFVDAIKSGYLTRSPSTNID